jgi:hypothetical protein
VGIFTPCEAVCPCGWTQICNNPYRAQFAIDRHRLENCDYWKGAGMPEREKYFKESNWLKAPDFKDGQKVVIEEFGEAKTQIGLRPLLRLKGYENPLGLNATNFDKLTEKFGDNEKDWSGKKITIRIILAPNPSQDGKEGPAVRIE